MKKSVCNYYVYILLKDKNPIYIGSTKNVLIRIKQHRKTKDFDKHYVLSHYTNKKDALIAENSLIRYISVFGDSKWLNGKNIQLVYDGFHKGLNQEFKDNDLETLSNLF